MPAQEDEAELDSLRREVVLLRSRVAELQRRSARPQTGDVSPSEPEELRGKTEAMARFALGIAHDFDKLLAVITGKLELLSQRVGPAPELEDSQRALASAANLSARLLAFARKSRLSLKLIEPNELVLSTLALMQRLVGEEVRLETDLALGLPRVRVDRLEIERALVNLVVNARDAMPGGGRVDIRTRARRGATPFVELSVEDQGTGIPEADRARIFEPFYSARGIAGGTGLGLAAVLGTLEQHGGTVEVTDRRGGGAVFTLVLPAVESPGPSDAPAPQADAPKPVARPLELLVIDDETMIADLVRRILQKRGHVVRVATEPEAALGIWAERGETIDLVICDVAMADVRGPELIARFSEVGVAPRVLFITGYGAEAAGVELGHPVLAKPFTAAGLWRAICDAIGNGISAA